MLFACYRGICRDVENRTLDHKVFTKVITNGLKPALTLSRLFQCFPFTVPQMTDLGRSEWKPRLLIENRKWHSLNALIMLLPVRLTAANPISGDWIC